MTNPQDTASGHARSCTRSKRGQPFAARAYPNGQYSIHQGRIATDSIFVTINSAWPRLESLASHKRGRQK
jgi:hypothetical protein